MNLDTIAAVSTGMTNSGIGIVRISGEKAFPIADKMFFSKSKKKLVEMKSHTIHYGYIADGDEMIDEVLVMLMRGPHSFTTEDTVEINCHGGVYAMKRILELAVKCGAKLAEPGEFTKRAFLNGRIDLSQAEAVMDVIQAKNEYALKSSVSQLKGSVLKSIRQLREKVLYEIAFIESALDDPEHISLDGYAEQLETRLTEITRELEKLIASYENGKHIREGIKTVIVGKPNAGKSSFLNSLLGEDRAIVTDIAGTTRDILEEQIQIHGVSLQIIDTAGIRETSDTVEKIGVDRAKTYAANADLILFVADASVPLDENDEQIIDMIHGKKGIILLNKSDLPAVTTEEILKKKLDMPVLPVSAKTGSGTDVFENTIKEMFYSGNLSFNDEIYITNMRQKEALEKALESLQRVFSSIRDQMPEDFFSIDLMSAYEELGAVIGETVEDDVVNEIFSRFCVGK